MNILELLLRLAALAALNLPIIIDCQYNPNLLKTKLKTDYKSANYHLKWVYNDYSLPIWLEKNTTNNYEYKWYKYSENLFIDDLDVFQQQYLTSQTADQTKLSILEYNFTTHEQLSSYEPKLVEFINNPDALLENYDDSQTDIFTLVYMKSHELIVNKQNDNKIEVSCSVKVMLPINDEYINDRNYNLIQKFLYIRMMLKDNANKEYSSQAVKKADKNHHHHNKHPNRPHTRSKREEMGIERNIPTTFIEVELREGPYSIFPDAASTNVSCTLGLIDFDDSIPYENLIFKVIQGSKSSYDDEVDSGSSRSTHAVYNTRLSTSTKRKKLINKSVRLETSLVNFRFFCCIIFFVLFCFV